MSRYIQLHLLTSYPACNLNRDDLGRPKTMVMGGAQRLRVSSQSQKRAWRVSDAFQTALADHLGRRTKELGRVVYKALTRDLTLDKAMEDDQEVKEIADKKAYAIARVIAGVFGKNKNDDNTPQALEIEQLAHVSPAELQAVAELVEKCRASGKAPASEELDLLRKACEAADIAMFGRMLAASKRFNVDAAVQVSHAMTVHTVVVEDDIFTAVDDLNRDDSGAGHMGVAEFGSGLFYIHICIDRDLLQENLDGDVELAA